MPTRDEYQDPDTMIPAGKGYPQSHDFGAKTFSARFGGATISPPSNDQAGMTAELNALVDLVFAQEATAGAIFAAGCTVFLSNVKLMRKWEPDIIAPLANVYYQYF